MIAPAADDDDFCYSETLLEISSVDAPPLRVAVLDLQEDILPVASRNDQYGEQHT